MIGKEPVADHFNRPAFSFSELYSAVLEPLFVCLGAESPLISLDERQEVAGDDRVDNKTL